jgi:hypothetical protein
MAGHKKNEFRIQKLEQSKIRRTRRGGGADEYDLEVAMENGVGLMLSRGERKIKGTSGNRSWTIRHL